MKKLIVALVILSLIACCGCIYSPSLEPTPAPAPIPEPTATNNTNEISETPSPEPTQESDPAPPIRMPSGGEGEPPEDMTWISPGVVEVSYFYPGATAEWPIRIHNGNNEVATFEVRYRAPDRLREGFEIAPEAAQSWVMITDPTPVFLPLETREIMIVVELPGDAIVPPKWEFWIAAKDTSQAGFVQTELCSRWLISMV